MYRFADVVEVTVPRIPA